MPHSVCRWPFESLPLPAFAELCQDVGIQGIDLLHPHEARQLEGTGLVCPITAAPDHPSGLGCIEKAFNQPGHHETLWQIYQELIPAAAAAGVSQVILFPGNRDGLTDAEGLENCARGIEPLLSLAEKEGVTLVMELLNSKVDHPDYMADHTSWGVALCEKLGSEHFKLLYDVYHMQVMEGDLIRTISENAKYISHYHTAGNPGRNELNATQEINYPAVAQAIADTGFTGFVAHEFIPTTDPRAALTEAVAACAKIN